MPELPEVETIRRGLAATVKGKTITGAEVLIAKIVKAPDPETFIRLAAGKRIETIGRHGKYLLLALSDGYTLVAHLRMTGQFNYCPSGTPVRKSTVAIFRLDDGHDLRFVEPRGFGILYLIPSGDLDTVPGLNRLGPEPFSPEFTVDYLTGILASRRAKIKSLLLDQSLIAGIGNIYADESLFRAGIHPERTAASLSPEEIKRLYHAIRTEIAAGIEYRGTSVQSYFDVDGRKGSYQEHLKVYQQTGQPCPNCGMPIQKIKVGGRGTHICPKCQH
jgi:formamidopyrimidine-DNA glycosylase